NQCFSFQMIEPHVRRVGNAPHQAGMHTSIGNASQNLILQTITECRNLLRGSVLERSRRDFRRFPKANYPGKIFRSGTALTLMRAAVHERLDLRIFADKENSRALRRMNFMARNRE